MGAAPGRAAMGETVPIYEEVTTLRYRIPALLSAALLLAVLVSACGSSGSSSSGGSSGSSTTEASSGGSGSTDLTKFEKMVEEAEAPVTEWPEGAPTEPIKKVEPEKLVVDITLSAEEPASLSTAEGVVEAAEALGWEGKILYGEFSAAKTAAAFEQAITLGADAVVTQGIEPNQYTSVIKKLHESGGILITTFSDFPVSEEYAQAEIKENTAKFGETMAAKAIVEAEGEGKIALFAYPEYKVRVEQNEASEKTLAECSGCEVLPVIDISAPEAEKTMPAATSTLLQKNPELKGIISGLDTELTQYQLPVIRQIGSDAQVYTTLGSQATMEAIEKEEINSVVTFPLTWAGWAAVDNAARIFAGQEINDGGLPQRLIDKGNIKEALEEAGPNGYWDADGFDYRGEFEKLWGLK
jgi:ribose transport system substrate-binding protein